MIVAAVPALVTFNSGADETCQVSEEIGLREGIRISERRIAASVVARVREIKPDMSPRESDESWPLSTRGSRSTAARMRHVRFPSRLVCARGFG